MSDAEIPSGLGVRERVLVEVDRLRQSYLAAKQAGTTLTWFGSEYWIDHVRGFVMLLGVAKELGFEQLSTAPDGRDDDIEYFGCRKAITGVWEMLRMLAAFVGGRERKPPGGSTDFINFTAVQPIVNPAFDSLFWLGLAWQMRPNREERNLGAAIGAMAYDLSTYPASQAEGPQIRRTQAEWLKSAFEPDLDVSNWLGTPDEDWAQHCKQVMDARRTEVDNVFFEIAHKARRMRMDPPGD